MVGVVGGDADPSTPSQPIAVPAPTQGALDYNNKVVAVVAILKTKAWARNPFYVWNDDWYHILTKAVAVLKAFVHADFLGVFASPSPSSEREGPLWALGRTE